MKFSKIAQKFRSSEIRELMKLATDPRIISFAGGMPNNELFPVDVIEKIAVTLPKSAKQAAFQYGPTGGYPPLQESLKHYLASRGLPTESNELLITTGAQQAINLLSKVFIDPGSRIITEYPSFIGALAAFNSYDARIEGIPMDSEGIRIDLLEEALEKGDLPAFLYLIPYFQNPAGTIYSTKRKEEVIACINRWNLPLLEDDPYGELWFDEKHKEQVRPMKAITQDSEKILYVGSFAKILGPGFRLGYMLVPTEVYNKCELAKQSQDACTSTYTQVLADAFLRQESLSPYLQWLRPIYKRRADIMLAALEHYMPTNAGISWTIPHGGFFIWVTLPEHIDSHDLFQQSIQHGAAFVVGRAFDPDNRKNNTVRLAFSHAPEDKIDEGIRIIAQALTELLG